MVKISIASIALVLAALISLPVLGQHAHGGRSFAHGGPRRAAPPPPQQIPPQMPARDVSFQRREANRDARMTPEERKQLRQDVNDHGREIYGDKGGQKLP